MVTRYTDKEKENGKEKEYYLKIIYQGFIILIKNNLEQPNVNDNENENENVNLLIDLIKSVLSYFLCRSINNPMLT